MREWVRLALLAAACALMVGTVAGAETLRGDIRVSQGDVTIPAGEVREGSVRVSQGSVRVDGVVRGDIHVSQGSVEVRGEAGSIRISQGRVEIAGVVNGDVEVSGGTVVLAPTARVHGRVKVDRGRVDRARGATVDGGVEVNAAPGEVVQIGPVRITDDVVEGPGFRIAPDGIFFPGGSITPGGVSIARGCCGGMHGPWQWLSPDDIRRTLWDIGLLGGLMQPFWHLFRWAGLFLLAAVTLAAIPQPVDRMASALGEAPLRLGGIGLLVLLLTPVALLLLIVTLIGIPLVPVALLVLLAAKFVGYVAVSAFVGDRLATLVPGLQGNHGKAFWRLLAGTLVLAVSGGVPFLGWIVSLVAAALGLGAVFATRFGTGRPWLGGTPPPQQA